MTDKPSNVTRILDRVSPDSWLDAMERICRLDFDASTRAVFDDDEPLLGLMVVAVVRRSGHDDDRELDSVYQHVGHPSMSKREFVQLVDECVYLMKRDLYEDIPPNRFTEPKEPA